MKKILLSLSVISLLSTVAVAESTLDGGAYVGIGFGLSSYGDNDLAKDKFAGSSLDKSDMAFRTYGGWQFNKIVGLEVGYSDYGSFQLGVDTIEASSFNVAANLGYTFLDGQLRPFALVGLSYMNSDYPDGSTYDIDANSVGVHTGLGIVYAPSSFHGIGFRLAVDADTYGLDYISSGDTKSYTQTMASTYLGVDYHF